MNGLDALDRRIVGALQVDGRASWRRIAEVLGESYSTVTRRGNALLESGLVRVAAISTVRSTAIVEVTTEPGRLDEVARLLAERPASTFVYALTAPSRILFEEFATAATLADAVLEQIPALPGVREVTASPVLDYYRTIGEWMPALIDDDEVRRLRPDYRVAYGSETGREPNGLTELDRAVRVQLAADGRASVGAIADRLGATATAVRASVQRRLTTDLRVRAVVEPHVLGFPVEALVWIEVAPGRIREIAGAIADRPETRYAVMTMGERMLLVDVAVESVGALRAFLADADWSSRVGSLASSPVLRAYKRGGVTFA